MVNQSSETCIPVVQQISSVLWPSFLVASIANAVFFTLFDPVELTLYFGLPDVTRTGGYSIGFFLFWLTTALSSLGTSYFQRPCSLVNSPKQAPH